MRNFRDYQIWNDAIILTKQVYGIISRFPDEEKYGLKSQIQRATVSIASNIAEGASRKSEADFARFLEISLGSAFELETQLIIAKELSYINKEDFDLVLLDINTLQRRINSLITKIRK
jgi:four helix bundle protein